MLHSTDPTTGQKIHEETPDSDSDIQEKVGRAMDAFESWRERSFAERGALLRRVAALLREREEALAPLMTREMGKPAHEALGEIRKSAWCAEHYAEHAEAYLAPEIIASDATHSRVQHLPLGPVLGILPWNAPFWLAFRFCAPALMAGNPCLMKHDPHVSLCARAIAELFAEAGAPAGVFEALFVETPKVEAILRDPRIHAVSFTGSDRAGAIVAGIAASELKPSVLELGGSDPAIVLADADLEKAADTLVLSRIINAGQSCIAAKRMIVEASIYPTLEVMLRERLAALRVGAPSATGTQVGPLAREDLRDQLHDQVERSVREGARLVLGGVLPDGPGWFYPVTMLADVKPHMACFREETFGPVAALIRADDADHALALANDTVYGLGASIWTTRERGEAMAAKLQAGQVSVNGIVKTDPRLPSGGIGRSGWGRELGPHGIRAFVNVQQVWIGPVRT